MYCIVNEYFKLPADSQHLKYLEIESLLIQIGKEAILQRLDSKLHQNKIFLFLFFLM